jgi:hypothetical protein
MPEQAVKPGRKERMPGPKAFVYGRLFDNPDVAKLTYAERWLWVYIITHADHDGRGRAEPEFLKAEAFAYDARTGVKRVCAFLENLSRTVGLLIYQDSCRLEGNPGAADCANDTSTGRHRAPCVHHQYFQVTSWRKFQVIDRAYYRPSEYPAPPAELYSDPWYVSDLSKTEQRRSNGGDKSPPLVPIRLDPLRSDLEREKAQGKRDAREETEPRPSPPVGNPLPVDNSPLETVPCPLKDGSTPLLIRWGKDLGIENPGNQDLPLLATGLEKYCLTLRTANLCRSDENPCGCAALLEKAVAHVKAMTNTQPKERIAALAAYLPTVAKRRETLEFLAAGGAK